MTTATHIKVLETSSFSPWGPWATLGLTSVIVVVFLIIQMAVLVLLGTIELLQDPRMDREATFRALARSGFCLSVATCVTTGVCTPLVFLFARLRRTVPPIHYLGFTPAWRGEWVRWLTAVLVLEAVVMTTGLVFDLPEVQEFIVVAYETAGSLPLLWFAIVVAGPIFEEVLFRGFLFEGLRHSMVGVAGSVLLTAFAWTGLHFQYDVYDLTLVFVLGMLFGAAKAKTGSLYLTIGMHALVNVIAMVNVTIYAQ